MILIKLIIDFVKKIINKLKPKKKQNLLFGSTMKNLNPPRYEGKKIYRYARSHFK